MLKKLFFVALIVLGVQQAEAQVVVQRDYSNNHEPVREKSEHASTFAYKFGVKAGVNMSTMSNGMDNFEPGFKMGAGFHIGGLVNLRWGQRTENSLPGTGWFGIQPELLYSMVQVGSDSDNLQMHTLQVPVMIKIYPTTQLSFEVGPQFTYVLSTSPNTMAVDGTQLKVGDMKGLNVGIGAGVAYDFDMGLTLGARYSYGFTKMAKNLDWKNSNIQVSIGWMF